MRRLLLLFALVLLVGPLAAEDWPEWRGKGRAGVWTEDGILERFPEQGLKVAWRVPVGEGYAGPAVADGRIFVMDFVRDEGIAGSERVLCLDEKTGKLIWKHEWPVSYAGTQPKWANGPRATPTVDGKHVYVVGTMGRLLCLEAASGKLIWTRDYVEDYGAAVPAWGFVSSPLVHGKLLIALVGGEEGALVVAFDKLTGKESWRSLTPKGESGYVPPIVVDAGGVQQLIVWHPEAVSSLNPATGKPFWEEPFEIQMALAVATPVVDDGRLFVSSFFNGSMMLALDPDKPGAKVVWRIAGKSEIPDESRSLHALITTPILDGDHIYGIGSYGELRGLQTATGKRLWASLDLVREQARWAAGLIVRQGKRYFINTDRGDLVIATFTPQGYVEIDRTHLIEPTTSGGGKRKLGAVNWSHPAYANRHIVARNDREIIRASLAR